mmetsp:Transcript_8754/g.19458  ORF Transcript_8754/g.19458 Transcript_8754/m.19458 type:complete len:249 (+) Transcript_8754:74-820(+)
MSRLGRPAPPKTRPASSEDVSSSGHTCSRYMCCRRWNSTQGARLPDINMTAPSPGRSTSSATRCAVAANIIIDSRAHVSAPSSPLAHIYSVINCAMNCSSTVSTKVTRNHGPCASSTTSVAFGSILSWTRSPASKSAPSGSRSKSGLPASAAIQAVFTGSRESSILCARGDREAISMRSVASSKRRAPTAASCSRNAALTGGKEPSRALDGLTSRTPSVTSRPSLRNVGARRSCVWKLQTGYEREELP